MKKILKTLALATLGLFALASCEDVPAPYIVPGSSNGTVKLEGTGSFDSPYNVAAANKLARELEQSSTSNTVLSEEVYVKGIISQIESIDTVQFGNATYYISEDGTTANQLEVYRGKGFDGAKFTSENDIKVGDTVVVCGQLQNWLGKTMEFTTGSKIVYLNGKVIDAPQPTGEATGTGTADDPFNVAAANKAASKLQKSTSKDNTFLSAEVYVKGIISKIDGIDTEQFGNATYFVSDDGTDNGSLEVFRGYSLGGAKFKATDEINVGDTVIVCGKLQNWLGTYEFTQGSKITYLNGKTGGDTPTPTPTGEAKGDGTLENPFNIPAANAYIAAGQNLDKEVYVEGTISQIKSLDVSKWQRAQYYISDDGTTTNQFLIYNGYYLGGADFTANDQIKVGDKVIVCGKLKDYNGTYEMDQNNKIVSLNGNTGGDTPTPTPSGEAKGDGTLENPFNIPAANAYIAAGQNLDKEVYVEGTISQIKSLDVSKWQRAQYYISDDGTTTNQFLIYNGYYLGGADFTANDQIKVGDKVIVCGKLKDYNGTYEMDQNNKIVSLNGNTGGDTPTPTPQPTGDADFTITSSDIQGGATGSVTLGTNAYGSQAVGTESTWYTFKTGDINWTGCRICVASASNGGGIQVQGNASDATKQGFIYNTSAFPAMQTIVVTTHTASQYAPTFTLYAGTAQNPSTVIEGESELQGEKTYIFTFEVGDNNYTYLKIWNNLVGVLYIDKIEVYTK